jgi:hypothetical protein
MQTETLTNQITQPAKENEVFWLRHNELHKTSGLTRKQYCRQNNLNYDRLGYWIHKWNRNQHQNPELVSVKLKTLSAQPSEATLCTLQLSNGSVLKIHNAEALSAILERMG